MLIEEEFKRARALVLPSTITLPDSEFNTYALLDNGCEGQSFIDLEFAKEKKIPLMPLRKPFKLVGYDGELTESRTVKYYVRADFRVGDHLEKEMVMFVTLLAHYYIILGLPWLEKHDPQTLWAARTITFSSKYCRENCNTPEQPQHQEMLKELPKNCTEISA